MQARILGANVELTPLDEKMGVYSCDLSRVGLGNDCVVKRQRHRASRHERFSTPTGMQPSVDYWLIQYVLTGVGDRVQRQLSPDSPSDASSTVGQVMPLFMSAGMGRAQDVMLFKGARYCTRRDYEEGKKLAASNRAAWIASRSRNTAMQQLASEVARGVQVQFESHVSTTSSAASTPQRK